MREHSKEDVSSAEEDVSSPEEEEEEHRDERWSELETECSNVPGSKMGGRRSSGIGGMVTSRSRSFTGRREVLRYCQWGLRAQKEVKKSRKTLTGSGGMDTHIISGRVVLFEESCFRSPRSKIYHERPR